MKNNLWIYSQLQFQSQGLSALSCKVWINNSAFIPFSFLKKSVLVCSHGKFVLQSKNLVKQPNFEDWHQFGSLLALTLFEDLLHQISICIYVLICTSTLISLSGRSISCCFAFPECLALLDSFLEFVFLLISPDWHTSSFLKMLSIFPLGVFTIL